MNLRLISLILFSFTGFQLIAQTRITGLVKESSGIYVADIYVIAGEPGSEIVSAYSVTGDDGRFVIKLSSELDSILIRTSKIGYAETKMFLANKNQEIELIVSPQTTNLREIVIRPEAVKRRGDTLDFYVQRFASVQDRSIGDVIRKLPGIEVRPSGHILYQGKAINEFMVENLDLMGGKYGGIVNNLSYDDVATVQILENHEPIRAKKEISDSDQAAINLKLKEGSKNKYLRSFSLGTGLYPILWNNEASIMQFALKKQTNIVYKGNNSGENIDGELTQFYGNRGERRGAGVLGIPGSIPPISNSRRYLYNNAHLISINRLYSISGYATLRVQGDYLSDMQKQSSSLNTSYVIGKDSMFLVSEKNRYRQSLNKASLSATYNHNSPSFFINNTIKGIAEWRGVSGVTTNISERQQSIDFKNLTLLNNFNLFKVIKKNRLEIKSSIVIGNKNEDFTIENGINNVNYGQSLKQSSIYTVNEVVYGGGKNGLNYTFTAGVDFKSTGIESLLSIDMETADTLLNNFRLSDFAAYLSPNFTYRTGTFFFNFTLPLIYNNREKREKIKEYDNSFYSNPTLGIRYANLTNRFGLSLNLSRNHKKAEAGLLNRGYVLVNYRTLTKGGYINQEDLTSSAYLSLNINRAEKLSSTYASIVLSERRSSYLIVADFIQMLMYRYLIPAPVKSLSFSSMITWSKGFDFFLRKIQLSPSYTMIESRQIQGGKDINNISSTLSANLNLDLRLWEESDVRYYLGWANSFSKSKSAEKEIASGTINSLSQSLSFQSVIINNLSFKAFLEHRKLFNDNNIVPSTFFIDGDIIFKSRRAEYSVSLLNILNTKEYAIKYLSGFSNSENLYYLRPRSIMFTVRFRL